MSEHRLTIGQCATLACVLESTAPKPGNVHRGADFEDLRFTDFLTSAVAIGPVMDRAPQQPVGTAVLEAIQATRRLVATNTILGAVLLLAPLAKVPRGVNLDEGLTATLLELTADDARRVYEAIRMAQPGGLGKVDEMDVAAEPPADLLAAMRAAAPRDMVARQYAENFDDVLSRVVPWLVDGRQAGWSPTDTIVHTHVRLMSHFPDSLIARKCGTATAEQSAVLAAKVLDAGEPGGDSYLRALADLDFWLRSDRNRRNPGTTADLIAAGLFAALRDEIIEPPFR